MKKYNTRVLLPAVLLLLAAGQAVAADYPTTVNSYNPLGYWRFDETSTSPALNSVANSGSLGSTGNGYVVLDVLKGQPGKIGTSVRLNNPGMAVGYAGSKIDVPYNPALNGVTPFTLEFWYKPNDLGADATGHAIVSSIMNDFAASSRSGYLVYINNAGRWEFRLGNQGGYVGTVNNGSTPSANGAVGVWSHVVAQFDGANTKIFINGNQVASRTLTALEISSLKPNTQMPFRISGTGFQGSLADGPAITAVGSAGNRGVDGWVDEVAYYNYALTPARIAAHFTASSTPASYPAAILADNPVGYWNLDEPAATTPTSFPSVANSGSQGSSADGTTSWGVSVNQNDLQYAGFGPTNRNLFFDGYNGSVAIAPAAGLSNLTQITMMAWIKPAAKNYFRNIIAQGWDENYAETFLRIGRGGGNAGYGTANYYEVGTTDGVNTYGSALYPIPEGDIGNWVFIAGTYDGANWNVYRNGVLVSSAAYPQAPFSLTNAWKIGSRFGPPSPTFFFSGYDLNYIYAADGLFFGGGIDEPAIFGTALSGAAIAQIYNSANVPPVITRAPAITGQVYKGDTVSLSVWAEGSPTLSYSWTSNGVPLGVTTTNIAISNVPVGTQTFAVIVTNPYGSITSSVSTVVVSAPPSIAIAPQNVKRFNGSPFTMTVVAGGSSPLSYQWKKDGVEVSGATAASYTATASAGTGGSYTCVVTNEAGNITSAAGVLTVSTPNPYNNSVLMDVPFAYWRLGETNGSTAYDYLGTNNGIFFNAALGQAGYSIIDSDKAAAFSGDNSYVGAISGSGVNFEGTNASFTIEMWVNAPEGLPEESTLIAKGTGSDGTTANEQFAIDVSGGKYRFLTRGNNNIVYSADAAVGPNGTWQHVVAVYDSANPADPQMYIYVNGEPFGPSAGRAAGVRASTAPVSIGSKRSGNSPTYDLTFGGTIDEVVVYNSALNISQIQAHYGAAAGPSLPPTIALQPAPATNFVGLPVTFQVGAYGTVPLAYQWKKNGVDIPGATDYRYTIPSLSLSPTDAGNYSVSIVNSLGTTNSSAAALTILPAPTSPPAIAGLVLHLPMDNNLTDVTGRGNSGTPVLITQSSSNVSAAVFTAGQLGQALKFQTSFDTNGFTNITFVTLGKKPDLNFGTNVNFTIAYWIKGELNYIGGDLPFICNTLNSANNPGYMMGYSYGPSADNPWPGGWAVSIYDTASVGFAGYGEIGTINDGNWHHLVHVFDRQRGHTTYLDGKAAKFIKQSGSGMTAVQNLDSGYATIIGQDPSGRYPEAGSAEIDDIGIWKKALSPLEAASLYVAATANNLSFTGTNVTMSILRSGSNVQIIWNDGFLEAADNVQGPYTTVAGATSPYTVPPAAAKKFYRARL